MAYALSYKEFIEEYDQNHIRRFRIPSKFLSQYRYTARLTYDEWMTLLASYVDPRRGSRRQVILNLSQ